MALHESAGRKYLRWSWRRDRKGEYRVRAVALNRNKEFASTEGYARKGGAFRNAQFFGMPPAVRQQPEGVEVVYKHELFNGVQLAPGVLATGRLW